MISKNGLFAGAMCALVLVGLSACGGGGGNVAVDDSPVAIAFALQPVDTVITKLFDASVVFLDAEGHVKPIDGLPVSLYLENNTTGATLLGTTHANSKFGVAYFFYTLTVDAVGEGYTLRAEAGDLVAYSDPFDILPVQIASIAFASQPASTPLYQGFGCSVELRDQTGTLLPRDDVEVILDLVSSPAGGTLSGTLSALTVAGVATFSGLNIDAIGADYVIRATAGAFTRQSSPFAILPPPPVGIAFVTQPSDGGTGVPIDTEVELLDVMGTRVPQDGLTINLTIQSNPGGATLGGTTSLETVQGLSSFTGASGFTIDKPAAGYTIRATHGSLSVVSDPFEVVRVFTPPVWVDPSSHTQISPSDDGFVLVSFALAGGANFPFYGSGQGSCYVNGNGNITFGGGDSDFSESVSEMASDTAGARIAPWWHDLSPQAGTVYSATLSDRTIITFVDVPEYYQQAGSTCTWQLTMYEWGQIDIVYGDMTTADEGALVGISPGNGSLSGTSTDFTATVYPSWTSFVSTFPYEDFSGTPDLTNAWISFMPLGPSFDGSNGYQVSGSG